MSSEHQKAMVKLKIPTDNSQKDIERNRKTISNRSNMVQLCPSPSLCRTGMSKSDREGDLHNFSRV